MEVRVSCDSGKSSITVPKANTMGRENLTSVPFCDKELFKGFPYGAGEAGRRRSGADAVAPSGTLVTLYSNGVVIIVTRKWTAKWKNTTLSHESRAAFLSDAQA